jgi:hypothetical protein
MISLIFHINSFNHDFLQKLYIHNYKNPGMDCKGKFWILACARIAQQDASQIAAQKIRGCEGFLGSLIKAFRDALRIA